MIRHGFRAHPLKHLIERFGGVPFEPRVLLTRRAHTVDDFIPVAEVRDELVHRVHIVLQIGIHGDGRITALVFGDHQSGEERILMAPVMGQFHAAEQQPIGIMQVADDIPSTIFGTVIDEQNAASLTDLLSRNEPFDFRAQHFRSVPQSFRLVVAGEHKVDNRSGTTGLPITFLVSHRRNPSFYQS